MICNFFLRIGVYLTEQLSKGEYPYVPEGFKIKSCMIKLGDIILKTRCGELHEEMFKLHPAALEQDFPYLDATLGKARKYFTCIIVLTSALVI